METITITYDDLVAFLATAFVVGMALGVLGSFA